MAENCADIIYQFLDRVFPGYHRSFAGNWDELHVELDEVEDWIRVAHVYDADAIKLMRGMGITPIQAKKLYDAVSPSWGRYRMIEFQAEKYEGEEKQKQIEYRLGMRMSP